MGGVPCTLRYSLITPRCHMVSMVAPYFLLFFLALWFGISFLLSVFGGWRQLSKHYRSTGLFKGQRFYFQSAAMRLRASYNSVLTFGINIEGLYLSVLFPFRIGHPPLFVPWEDISCTEKPGRFFGGFELHFAKCPTIPFLISRRLMEKVAEALRDLNRPAGANSPIASPCSLARK